MINYNLLNETKNAIIFAYICRNKEDYASNIEKVFKKAIKNKIWNKKSLKQNSYLTNLSNLIKLLNKLEEANLIISKMKGRRKYYRINPEIFYNDKILKTEAFYIKTLSLQNGYKQYQGIIRFNLLENLTKEEFLINFKKFSYAFQLKDSSQVISSLNIFKKFDFIMILLLIKYSISLHTTERLKYMDQTIKRDGRVHKFYIKEQLMLGFFELYFNDFYHKNFITGYLTDEKIPKEKEYDFKYFEKFLMRTEKSILLKNENNQE